jgi:acyl-CoA thioesterase-1
MNKSKPIAVLFAVALLLGACGSRTKIEKLAPDAVILAFGDSLTFGTGAASEDSYPASLERSIKRKVVNAGVPGETSARGLARLPGVLDEVKPNLLVLCHGGNDFLQKLGDAQAAANVRAMIMLARERGIPVVLVATPKPGFPPSVPPFYGEIAAELVLPYDDGIIRTVLFDNSLKSDLVHPNGKGYQKIAEAVRRILEKSGAI